MTGRHHVARPRRFAKLGTAGVVAAALTASAVAVVVGATAAGAASSVVLTAGQRLTPGQTLGGPIVVGANKALNHRYELTLTSGGNLEIVNDYLYQDSKSVIWQTHTSGASYAVIGSDGNFVLAGTSWHSGTAKSGMPTGALVTKAVLDTNGALTLQTAGGTAEWRSSNGLCAKVSNISNGRESTEISAACREVAASTWYTWNGGHHDTPGRTYGSLQKGNESWTQYDPSRIGFDCSGFTRWAFYLAMGRDIPHNGGGGSTYTWQEFTNNITGGTGMDGSYVGSKSNLKPGDFVFFSNSNSGGYLHHTAIYIGGGYIVEAPGSRQHIKISLLSSHSDYYNAIRTTAIGG